MLKLIATTSVFFNWLLLLAAQTTAADAGSVTWEKDFRPIYPEVASYPRATVLSDDRVLVAFAHPTPVGRAIACVVSSDSGKSWAGYHVYGFEWGKDELRFYVDGVVVRTVENTHWHQPLFLIFDSETMPEWMGMPKDEDLPSTFSVEYVRAWKLKQ